MVGRGVHGSRALCAITALSLMALNILEGVRVQVATAKAANVFVALASAFVQ